MTVIVSPGHVWTAANNCSASSATRVGARRADIARRCTSGRRAGVISAKARSTAALAATCCAARCSRTSRSFCASNASGVFVVMRYRSHAAISASTGGLNGYIHLFTSSLSPIYPPYDAPTSLSGSRDAQQSLGDSTVHWHLGRPIVGQGLDVVPRPGAPRAPPQSPPHALLHSEIRGETVRMPSMAAKPSTMLPLGTPLPPFRLTDAVSGKQIDSASFKGAPGLLVMFICNHCPYVIHLRQRLVELVHEAQARGLKAVAINSNSRETHPQDGPEAMRSLATEEAWRFPFLFDETQEVAKAFQAACTPDFFLFDSAGKLAYRGQMDGSRPSSGIPVTGADLRAAIDAVLASRAPAGDQKPSIGCNIKWAPGNAPAYFG
jgi:peroxiredoxin